MVQNFKYIIVDSGAILFNEMTTHAQVAEGFTNNKQTVYSAGFVQITFALDTKSRTIVARVEAHGKSDSLNIESQPEVDRMIISDLFIPVSAIKYFGLIVKEFYK